MRAAIFILVVIGLLHGSAPGCSCDSRPSVADAFAEAKVVFAGRCVSGKLATRQFDAHDTYEVREFTFDVDEAWKGVADKKQLVIETNMGDGDCGYDFSVGYSYVVYASAVGDRLMTHICTRTFFTGRFSISKGEVPPEATPEIDALDAAAKRPKRNWPKPGPIPGLDPIPKSQ